ncbi:Bax inhibitor-1/YccA family protein [Paractinoplanes globisporus]|uniref:Bax inhibitor-1/YccA family protein n=1 Tax=Paractinoplanes globisporus TaxID=113565 RepID=A0ABW6WH76_9ACTN|nr:Bax inhibitor-1/YccA family protein [Actinoplanes globisporus]
MKSSNPVLSRLGQAAEQQRTAGQGYAEPYPTTPGLAAPPVARAMTIDDVVVKTVILLGITAISAIAAWNIIPDAYLGAAWIGAAIVGLVLGLVISFSRMANPTLVVVYAVVEGVFVGMVSKTFESFYNGIVLQAVVATFGVFALMAVLYTSRVIRSSPRFRKIMIGAIGGLFMVMLINLVLSLFGVHTGLRGGGALSIGFSLVCIVVAALSFVLDFDQIEQGVRMGLPQRYSWTCAFGILVGLIWLYLEILQLLSYLQGGSRN